MQRFFLAGLMCLLMFAGSAHGQTGRFSGQVTDSQNAAIVGATVETVNEETAADFKTKTDESGNYVVPYLPAGHYRVVAQAPGFSASVNTGLELKVGEVFVFNIQLAVGAQQDVVHVDAGSEVTAVDLQSPEVSGTITGKEVSAIGLNGRNFSQLIALVPGVSNQTQQDEARVGLAGSVSYSVNGGRTEYNSFQVDGSEVLNVGINRDHSSLIVTPSIDAIQEIKVLTSNYGAEYPSTGNGTTIVTTKSGTDRFHGNIYEFLRNEAFNAKGYFDIGDKAPVYRRNDFGGTIGGPVLLPKLYDGKGKTHFFVSEEQRIESDPYPYRQAVPSDAERQGNFLDVCPAAYATYNPLDYPDCPQVNGLSVIQNFDNHSIVNPAQGYLLNRNALAILSTGVIPRANSATGCNPSGSCYLGEVSLPTSWREDLFRIDHRISDKLQAGLRYIHDEWSETVPIPLYSFTVNSFPTIENRVYGPGTSLVFRLTGSLSATLLNEVVVSYTDSRITLADTAGAGASIARPAALDAPCAKDPLSPTTGLGVPQCPIGSLFPNNGYMGKLPGVVIGGNNAEYGGTGFAVDPGYMPWSHSNPIYSVADNVAKTIGPHNLQIGAQWVIYQRNQTNGPIGAATGETQGIVTFSNQKGQYSTGNSFADFLLHFGDYSPDPVTGVISPTTQDAVASFQQDSAQGRYRQRYQLFEPYVQDDYKITRRLTLDLGVRVSFFGTFHDVSGQSWNWVPANAYGPGTGFNPAEAFTVSTAAQGYLVDRFTGLPLPFNAANPSQGLDPRITNGLVRCGSNGIPSSCMKNHLVNPAPRVGFAWDVLGDGKTALRAGYGYFYEHGTADEANTGSLEGSSPPVLDMIQNNPASWDAIGSALSNNGQQSYTGVAFPLNVSSIPTKAVWPYVQQWSLSVERALPSGMLATFAYVGSKGTNLTTQAQENQLQPLPASQNPFGLHEPLNRRGTNFISSSQTQGDCPIAGGGYLENGTYINGNSQAWVNLTAACYGATGGSVLSTNNFSAYRAPDPNTLRQFAPGFGEIFQLQNIANSAYSAFQGTLRRTQGAVDISAAYTYSHSLDDASDRSDTTFVDTYNLRSNRASSNFDQRHLLHISYVYTLPGFHSQPAVARAALSGWQLSGVTLYETGIPFTVVNGGSSSGIATLDNAGVANGTGSGSYPDLVGNPRGKRPSGGNPSSSFGPLLRNPAAFAAPRGLTFGNAGRNVLNNPARWNSDAAVLKHFSLPGETQLEFRAEAFNIFNQTQFRIYNPTLGDQANNTISCYGAAVTGYSAGSANCLTGSSFLHPIDAHRPRTLQFALKLAF